MRVVETSSDVRAINNQCAGIIGFVPTMGALHEGHASLLKRARSECDFVVVSIYVNPTQFEKESEHQVYPRDLERDMRLCEEIDVDLIFTPDNSEIYPANDETVVSLPYMGEILEGASRPGHFAGVAGVVLRLLNIVGADRAYFGAKDAQQIRVIKKLVKDLHIATTIVECPTVRTKDGLALSSRNVFLDSHEYIQALSLSEGLFKAHHAFLVGERSAKKLRALVRSTIEDQDIISIDYVSLADSDTLVELTGNINDDALLSIAATVGSTRLIDNIVLAI